MICIQWTCPQCGEENALWLHRWQIAEYRDHGFARCGRCMAPIKVVFRPQVAVALEGVEVEAGAEVAE